MHAAFGVAAFPRVAGTLDEILFPIEGYRLAFAAQAMRAAARLAVAPDVPAVHESVLEGLTSRFILLPEAIEHPDDAAGYDARTTLRQHARAAAHRLLGATPDAMLGCDIVMVSRDDDVVAERLGLANEEAQRKAGRRVTASERVLVGEDGAPFRADWLRLPPIMRLVRDLLGNRTIDLFLAKQPAESIRVMILEHGKPSIFDID